MRLAWGFFMEFRSLAVPFQTMLTLKWEAPFFVCHRVPSPGPPQTCQFSYPAFSASGCRFYWRICLPFGKINAHY